MRGEVTCCINHLQETKDRRHLSTYMLFLAPIIWTENGNFALLTILRMKLFLHFTEHGVSTLPFITIMLHSFPSFAMFALFLDIRPTCQGKVNVLEGMPIYTDWWVNIMLQYQLQMYSKAVNFNQDQVLSRCWSYNNTRKGFTWSTNRITCRIISYLNIHTLKDFHSIIFSTCKIIIHQTDFSTTACVTGYTKVYFLVNKHFCSYVQQMTTYYIYLLLRKRQKTFDIWARRQENLHIQSSSTVHFLVYIIFTLTMMTISLPISLKP